MKTVDQAWREYGVDDDMTPPEHFVAGWEAALAQPASTQRWNIERDGDDLLVCFNEHEKGEACEYVRYVQAPPAVPEGFVLVTVESLVRWRDAFNEELTAWDIDPPLYHVQASYDEIVAMLAAADRVTRALAANVQPKHTAEAVAPWQLERMRHIANEWADMAANGMQWLRNIRDGISTVDDALANMAANYKHCRKVNDTPGLYGSVEAQPPVQAAAAPSEQSQAPAVAHPAWQPIKTAPKDGTVVLGYCVHAADPYHDGTGLTNYGARTEGLSHVEDGVHAICWEESYEVSDGWESPSFTVPAGWISSSDVEKTANPTHWMPVPAAPSGQAEQGDKP